MARRTGYSPAYLSRIELGQNPPTYELAKAIAKAAGSDEAAVCRELGVVPYSVLSEARTAWLRGCGG